MKPVRIQAKVLGRVIADMQKEASRLDGEAKTELEEQIEVMREVRNTLRMLITVKEALSWLLCWA